MYTSHKILVTAAESKKKKQKNYKLTTAHVHKTDQKFQIKNNTMQAVNFCTSDQVIKKNSCSENLAVPAKKPINLKRKLRIQSTRQLYESPKIWVQKLALQMLWISNGCLEIQKTISHKPSYSVLIDQFPIPFAHKFICHCFDLKLTSSQSSMLPINTGRLS